VELSSDVPDMWEEIAQIRDCVVFLPIERGNRRQLVGAGARRPIEGYSMRSLHSAPHGRLQELRA
jgi:hypothetical protein